MKTKSMPVIWSKINSRRQKLELCGDPNRTDTIELWVDDKPTHICGAKFLIRQTSDPTIFALSTMQYGLTRKEKEEIEKVLEPIIKADEESKTRAAQNLKSEMAKHPGVEAATAKYGTYDQAHTAEDVVAADLLMQWENRPVPEAYVVEEVEEL